MTDEEAIIYAANRVGLQQWQLDRSIVGVIKFALSKYQYWANIDAEIKAQLGIK